MEVKEFFKRLSKKEYDTLEKELLKDYRKNMDIHSRFLLGICYSKQYKRKDDAIIIFKELMNTDSKHPNMYLFVAKHTQSNIESSKIIKEGLKFFPDNARLKNQLLFYIDDTEKEIYFEQLKKNNEVSLSGLIRMMSFYFKKEEYEKAYLLIKELEITDDIVPKADLKFLKILIPYLAKKEIDESVINSFIVVDNNTLQGLIVRLIEIDLKDDNNIAKKLLEQLNYISQYENPFLEVVNLTDDNHSFFAIANVFYTILNRLESKFDNEIYKRKIKLISAFQKLVWEEDFTKQYLRQTQKLIEEELKKNNNNKVLYSNLISINEKLGNNKKYFDAYIRGINYVGFENICFDNFSDSELDYVVNYITTNVRIYDFNCNEHQNLIENLIFSLHNRKKYSSIVKISENIDYKKLKYLNFGFELAFALNEHGKDSKAKEIYEEYLETHPNSDAVLNNLGVIYENEGNFEKALDYYEKSENLYPSKTSANNILRSKKLIEQRKKEIEIEEKSLEYLQSENIWIINRIKLFYEEADKTGNIICPYKKLPIVLKCNEEKANDVLKQFVDKGYIFRNKNHNYDTNASVYKKNFSIEKRINEMEKENELISSFTDNLNGFTIDNLLSIEYLKILSKLNSVKKKKIKDIFIRDYNELVFNYLSSQQKTTILMSGTIIELLLLYILDKQKVIEYKVGPKQKKKKVIEMDITEMLEICDKERLIQNTPQKFMDGMKQFRNFIHPGKELREKALDIDKSTVELSFSIVNWLILNIDLK